MEQFTSPPRKLPIFTQLVILFGGTWAKIGWIIFGFGMSSFWTFFMNSNIIHVFDFSKWEEGTAIIKNIKYTGASENDEEVYEYIYEYDVQGEKVTGRGYMKGGYEEEGQAISIQYKASDHRLSKLTNGSREMFDSWAALATIFPLIGLIFILVSLKMNVKAIKLLINGEFTRGKLVNTSRTNTTVNYNYAPVRKYTFQFQAKDGSFQKIDVKPYEEINEGIKKPKDEDTERILYLPSEPSYAIVYDNIPNVPELDLSGRYQSSHPKKALVLIIPIITILAHGGWFLMNYVL